MKPLELGHFSGLLCNQASMRKSFMTMQFSSLLLMVRFGGHESKHPYIH